MHHNVSLQDVLQSCNHQDSMVLAQKQTLRSTEHNTEHRIDPQTYGQLIFDKAGKSIQWKKKPVSSSNGVGKTGQRHTEE